MHHCMYAMLLGITSMLCHTCVCAHVQVRTASCGATACVNSFGDEQLAVDLLADKLLFEALRFSHVCKFACSEEVPEPVDMQGASSALHPSPIGVLHWKLKVLLRSTRSRASSVAAICTMQACSRTCMC